MNPLNPRDRPGIPSRARRERKAPGTAITTAGPSRDDKVRQALDLMTGGEWVPGRSHSRLAEAWGCSPHTVEQVAQEAGRAIRMAVDPVAIVGRMMATLDTCARVALEDGDAKGAVNAIMGQAELLGLRKQNVNVGITDVDGMSRAEARVALAAACEAAKGLLHESEGDEAL